ncbi:MAG TPA: GNAT family N-acetyltransferase [Aeromonadales bacterium]|nr:GNAT family N-acetyltransferase [Aeromonadales bacterium]
MTVNIEALSQKHLRKSFDCGIPELNRFLQQQARQKTLKQIAKTYVAYQDVEPQKIIGYYTLTGYAVSTPPSHRDYKNYPHTLNAVKLARIAVDSSHQGKHIGELLLIDAIYRTVQVAEQISAIGLYVDPMYPGVIPFYKQYGFLPADPEQRSCKEMWLPVKTCIEIEKTLKS